MSPTYRFVVSAAVLAAAGYAGARPLGPLPALGGFLDPVNGVWGVAYSAELPPEALAQIPGLEGEVSVVYDDRRVPHIFAESELDARRALGYVVARDRLFEMEVQTRATAGTLTELAGPALLNADVQSRAMGLAWAAERDLEQIKNDPEFTAALEAYADGVNSFIDAMRPEDLPIEYHLLGKTPLRWEPIHTLYLLKRMGWTLSFAPAEFRKARTAALVGREAADALMPVNSPIREPVQPHEGARWMPTVIPDPGTPDDVDYVQMETMSALVGPMDQSRGWDGPVLGSNNWAVGPSKSATGNAILSGDPHLNLTLPSIWYEAHMVVEGGLDAAGVTMAGTPAIVIGFNRDVAWSFTNTGGDVLDYYRETLDDPEHPTSYLLDGEWEPLSSRIEEYRGPDGALLKTDTIYHTHRGPIVNVGDDHLSMHWTVLDNQGEVAALLQANRATSAAEWLDAMTGWYAPTQNGLVADRGGHIAIQSAGFYPDRPENTTGDWFYNGTTSNSDWTGSLGRYPRAVDPEQGYLASANQQPYDPDDVADYIGADWPSPWRALTINGLLRAKDDHTAADLEAYQTFPSGARSITFHAVFMEAAAQLQEAGIATPELREAATLLGEWNLEYTPDNTRAALFEAIMDAMQRGVWDELDDSEGRRVATPGTDITWALLDQPNSPWWDDLSTPEVEDRNAMLGLAMVRGLAAVREEHGAESGDGWRWSEESQKNIFHLLQIPALSRMGLPVTGGPGLLSPNTGRGTHGASWRMVVEMAEEVIPRGTFPGGQSGNPVSPGYDDRLDSWLRGELQDLRFPRTEEELASDGLIRSRLTLTGGIR
jgi:penicillin G amidase